MKKNKLNTTNHFLKKEKVARKMCIRSIASSTAITTGESTEILETKIKYLSIAPRWVTLA